MRFFEKLNDVLEHKGCVCVGLDTDPRKIPHTLRLEKDPVLSFNRKIIEATADLVCAYKLNFAFYEAAGARGWELLKKTVDGIPGGIITIADAKRGDIGNTARMYADAIFKELGFDCATVNAYMGLDAVEPFIESPEHGTFVLCLTSNPTAADFQTRISEGIPLYEAVARKVLDWNKQNNCGVVIGASRIAEMKRIRELSGDLPFLVPGVGAQGGSLEDVLMAARVFDRANVLVNASRSVLYSSEGEDFADAARREVLEMKRQEKVTLDKL